MGEPYTINDLPAELLRYILNDLVPEGLAGLVAQVCRCWREFIPLDNRNFLGARTILSLTKDEAQHDENEASLWKWATERALLTPSKGICVAAAATGRLDVLQALLDSKTVSREVIVAAAEAGHVQVLQWLYQWSQSWLPSCAYDACYVAARAGHTHILRWVADIPHHGPSYELSSYTARGAAIGGRLDTLKWIKAETDNAAAKERARGMTAAGQKKQQLAKFKVGNVFRSAAEGGHLHVLRWAVEELGYNPKADKHVYRSPAEGGSLAVLQWLEADLGIPYEGNWWDCRCAAKNGHLDALQWLAARGGPLDDGISAIAAESGHLHILQWLEEQGCPLHTSAVAKVAGRGHTEVLRWLYQQKGRKGLAKAKQSYRSTKLCTNAAGDGRLETLQFLRLEVHPPFPWGVETSTAAVGYLNGHVYNEQALAMLRWMREEAKPPCPWDKETSLAAVQEPRWKLLRWMCLEAQPPCPASRRTLRRLCAHEKEKSARKRGLSTKST
ncbi:Ankyrin repeat domain containing protein [Balamuthia mandrillaris]